MNDYEEAGIRRDLSFSEVSEKEEEILRKLSQVWFLSFVRHDIFKYSEYSYAFVKPTKMLAERFNLSREILIVFSSYRPFQPRSLDFVDKTIEVFRNRLDKLCVILISNDEKIKTHINRITIEDKESRVLIPFTYQELINEKNIEHAIIKRFNDYLYERDLFAIESPLKNDTYFFGRKKIIQDLYGKYKTGENGCLFGLRRIGKTSALLAVRRNMAYRTEPSVFIDCSEPSFHRRRWYEALFFIIKNIANTLEIPEKRLHSENEYDEKNASTVFEEDLNQINIQVDFKRLLIIFDEIENITFDLSPSDHWAKDLDFILFWQSIRSVFQKNPNYFSFIIAGVNPKAIETPLYNGFDNPIYRYVTPIYLPLFEVNEVKEMVNSIGNYMGIRFEEEIYTYLTDDFGGHPFLIRQVCSRMIKSINESRPLTIKKYWYLNERDKLNTSIQDYISLIVTILRERYKDEYELLEYLSVGDNKTFREFADLSRSMIEHLEGYGLIKEEGNAFYFRIKAVEEYVREHSLIKKKLNTKEEKWQSICLQRNTLETDLRNLIKIILKSRMSSIQFKEVIIEILDQERKRKFSESTTDQIINTGLYFDDLRKIIIKNWEYFSHIFKSDRNKFETNMTVINQQRGADCHAKDIDDNSMNIFQISVQTLQKQVDEVLK